MEKERAEREAEEARQKAAHDSLLQWKAEQAEKKAAAAAGK